MSDGDHTLSPASTAKSAKRSW